MNGYEYLYMEIATDLTRHYNTSEYEIRNNPRTTSAYKCRTHLHNLLLIEIALHEHRLLNRKSIASFSGLNALYHMAYQETKWTMEQIKSASVSDLLLVLQEKLRPENLSDEAQRYLKAILNNEHPPEIDLASYGGWQIGSGDKHLRYDL